MRKLLNEEIENEMRKLLAIGFENSYNENFEKDFGEYTITIYFEKIEEINEFSPYTFEPNKYYLFENANFEKEIYSNDNLEKVINKMLFLA